MKYLVGIAFVFIIGALVAAGFFMMRGGKGDAPKSRNMARALAVRVGLSILVFVLILISYQLGWIEPTGVPVRR